MFSSILRERLASVVIQIISVNDLCKELSPIYNFNTSNLRAYAQKIVKILQEIVTSVLLKLPVHEASNQLSRPSVQSKIPAHKVPNQLRPSAQSVLPAHKVPNQSISSTSLGPPVYEVFNQPKLST